MFALSFVLFQAGLEFNPPIARLPVILSELSKLAKTKLECAPELENEVFFIRASGQPPKEIMAEIAYVLEANWIQFEGKARLSRPLNWPETVKKRKEARIEKLLRETIARLPKLEPKTLDLADEIKRIRALRNDADKSSNNANGWYRQMLDLAPRLPAGRLLSEIMKTLGAKELAQVEPWGSAVYSNRPTKMQRPLPESLNKAIARFVAEHNPIAEKAGQISSDSASGGDYGPSVLSECLPLSPGFKLLVQVTVSETSCDIDLRAYEGGDCAAIASLYEGGDFSEESVGVSYPSKLTAELVDLNELSIQFFAERTVDESGRRNPVRNPKLLALLKQPYDQEPLQILGAEMLNAYAKKIKKPVVAVIPDTLWPDNKTAGPTKKFDLNLYLYAFDWLGGGATSHGDWQVLGRCPVPPTRLSRRALQDCLQTSERVGRLSLANMAELLARSTAEDEHLIMFYIEAVGLRSDPFQPFGLTHFYGALSSSQREQLISGSSLSPESLTGPQLDLLKGMIFGDLNDLPRLERVPTTALERWKTEYLPSGLVSPFSIRADYTAGESWFMEFSRGRFYEARPHSITDQLAAFERPDLYPGYEAGDPRKRWKFYKGEATVWDFWFFVSPKHELTDSIRAEVVESGRVYLYKELPKAYREDAEKRVPDLIARMEKFKAEAKLNPPKKGNPPPAK